MTNIKIEPLEISDAFIVRGKRFNDDRGFFQELYNQSKFEKPIADSWRQVSLAESKSNVLRGLHCSNYAKFVQVVKGEVYDVIVDLRPTSPTYLKWQGVWLNADADEPTHLYVPQRCGHGYFCKRESLFLYLQDGVYNPSEDVELNLFDQAVNVKWPEPIDGGEYIISNKDRTNPFLNEIKLKLEQSDPYRLKNLNILQGQYFNYQNRTLIYGATGFLGTYMIEEIVRKGHPFVIGKARLENREQVLNELSQTGPTRVICFAGEKGKPNISWCDTHQIETIRANVIAQLNLADVCHELNIHCTLLTTGVIYKYDNDKHKVNSGVGYTEEDTPNFDGNFYSKMRIVEENLLKSYPNVLALRISYPTTGDLNPHSFLTKITKYSRIENVPLSVTVVDDLWPILLDMSEKRTTGIFNFNNAGTISHNEILELYKKVVNNSHSWESVEADLRDRAACELSVEKLKKLGYEIPHIKDSIAKIINKLGKIDPDQSATSGAETLSKVVNEIKLNELTYKPKNILLTGGAGFIGSHVVIALVERYPEYTITVLDSLEYCSNLKNLDQVKDKPNFRFVRGDICNSLFVKFIVEHFEIDTIMHFAAQSHVDISIRNSIKFTEVNVMGTHVLLESARLCKIKRFIHVSTDEVYGTTGHTADINQALEPTNPYACSKLAAECIIMAYKKCFDMPVIISRGNNVYGPHQFLEKVIPKFINRLMIGDKCCIHGDGTSERDFLFVSDVVNAFDTLLHLGKPNTFYNIGASKGISVLELAQKIIVLMGKAAPGEEDKFIEYVEERVINDKRYKIDSSNLMSLGWSPKVDFDEGLKITIDWYRTHQNYWDNGEFALKPHPDENDINKFM